MKNKLMAIVMMFGSFAAVAPAAHLVILAPRPVVVVSTPVVVVGPRYYAAPVYPVYGVRTYGYRYSYGYRSYYGPHYAYRGYRR
jgi:hypothetical protein